MICFLLCGFFLIGVLCKMGFLLREGGFASLLFLYQICLNYIYVGVGMDPRICAFSCGSVTIVSLKNKESVSVRIWGNFEALC